MAWGRRDTALALGLGLAALSDVAVARRGAEKRVKEEEVAGVMVPVPYDEMDLLVLLGSALLLLLLGIQVAPQKTILWDFLREMMGTLLMVFCTFSPGPVFGHLGVSTEWPLHMIGVLVADRSMGGPHVNPGVTVSMFVWGKVGPVQALVIIAAQLVGAAAAFPLLQAVLRPFNATVGGPSFDPLNQDFKDGFANEFAGFAILMCGVYGFCCTALGSRYFIKQPLVAATIRFIIYFYGTTGPAINPALGTMWSFYDKGRFPRDWVHYGVYWAAPCLAGTLVALFWSAASKTGVFTETAPPAPAGVKTKAS